jgi:tRNA threonylcarbamoyladenosine biosynthesis protein TsaE
MKKQIIVKSLKEMNAFAAKVAKKLKGGEVLALTGELGVGKTAFVKGLAQALGVKAVVQSPTFLLMKCYPITRGKLQQLTTKIQTLCHVDAYRIKNPNELMAIGLGEKMGEPTTVTAIEWAELVADLLPRNAVKIVFEHGTSPSERVVKIKG